MSDASPPQSSTVQDTNPNSDVLIREAEGRDVPGVQEMFIQVYGESYPYQQFYDPTWLKRAIYTDNQVLLVAEDTASGEILGTASVVLDVGAHTDLIGEYGRLAVVPEARGRGVGSRLMEERIRLVAPRIHIGVVENRCAHEYSQKISHSFGLEPVGFLPLKHKFDRRESVALFAAHYGNGLRLRRNHPRIIAEAYPLAHLALSNTGLDNDVIVDEDAPAYPHDDRFKLETLNAEGLPLLMRIERGRLRNREVFGPMRLQYGFFKLTARRATYLVARDFDSTVAGAIGFLRDDHEHSVRIFELIGHTDFAIHFLLESLLDRCREDWGIEYVEVDVSGHAPRMQRTFLELGFLPAAFVPAMVFHDVERLDVIKMVRLFVPPNIGDIALTDRSQRVTDAVMRNFERQAVLPQLQEAVERHSFFRGLTDEQALRLAGIGTVRTFEVGEKLFRPGEPADPMYLVLDGTVSVWMSSGTEIGHVDAGDILGEVALLTESPHSAGASAADLVTVAIFSHDNLRVLTRQRPDIGLVLYRNLANSLSFKLRRLDARIGDIS